MGDGKGTTTVAPRVTARRTTRYTSRAAARSLQSVRAPIVMEVGSTVIRAGYADSSHPLHLISVPPSDVAASCQHNQTEAQWYTALVPWIDAVYDRLLCDPTSRKVVILHPQYLVPRAWEVALEQILWNKGVPAVTIVNTLQVLPVAQGWKRGFLVHISREEAVCVCHADGHVLPFTFQSVPECGYQSLLEGESTIETNWTPHMNFAVLDELHNPNSLVVAILKSLESCPRDIRFDVVHNMVFCGDGIALFPDLGRQVAKRLQDIMESRQELLEVPAPKEDEAPRALAAVPVPVKNTQTLASHLRLLSTSPHRPDFLPWVGASLWVSTWNRYQDSESQIPWKTAPQE